MATETPPHSLRSPPTSWIVPTNLRATRIPSVADTPRTQRPFGCDGPDELIGAGTPRSVEEGMKRCQLSWRRRCDRRGHAHPCVRDPRSTALSTGPPRHKLQTGRGALDAQLAGERHARNESGSDINTLPSRPIADHPSERALWRRLVRS